MTAVMPNMTEGTARRDGHHGEIDELQKTNTATGVKY